MGKVDLSTAKRDATEEDADRKKKQSSEVKEKQWDLGKIEKHNAQVCEVARKLSHELREIDKTDFQASEVILQQWLDNVYELVTNLHQQEMCAHAVKKDLRSEELGLSQSFRDKYNHIVETVKSRALESFRILPLFANLAYDTSESKGWDYHLRMCDADLKKIRLAGPEPGLRDLTSLIQLLNFYDQSRAILVKCMLYRHVVLDWDLKMHRDVAELGYSEVFDIVLNTISKHGVVLQSYVLPQVPHLGEGSEESPEGLFTEKGRFPIFASYLIEALRGHERLRKCLRNLEFGRMVLVDAGEGMASSEGLVDDVTHWRSRRIELAKELEQSNTQRDLKEEAVMNELEQRLAQQQDLLGQMARKRSELTSDLSRVQHDRTEAQAQLKETTDRYNKLATTSVPSIELLDTILEKTMATMNILEKDAFYFSDLFRDKALTIKEANDQKRKDMVSVVDVEQMVDAETEKIGEIEGQLADKERVILQNITGRKVLHDSLNELLEKKQQAENEADKNFREVQEMRDIVFRKKLEVEEYEDLLARAKGRVEELRNQQEFLKKYWTKVTGKPEGKLLEGFVLQLAPEEAEVSIPIPTTTRESISVNNA
jgi:hypothetical protein